MRLLTIILLCLLVSYKTFAQSDSILISWNSKTAKPKLVVNAKNYIILKCIIHLKDGKLVNGYSVYIQGTATLGAHNIGGSTWYNYADHKLFGYLDNKGNKINRGLVNYALEKGQW